jgi:hypothetical protein
LGSFLVLCVFGFASKSQAQNIPYSLDTMQTPMPGGLVLQAVGTESGYYDTNPLLVTRGAKALWGSITSPEIIVSDKTPLTTFSSDTLVNSNNFNQSAFDSNDVHSKVSIRDQMQRWSAGFSGNVDYDTTRTSELSNYNFTVAPVRHLGETLTPDIGYNFLPTDKLDLAAGYTESQYSNSIFTNYSTSSVTPTYSHDFDQQNTGSIFLQAQQYRALSGPSNTIDTIGPAIGWQRAFTEQLTGKISVGYQEIHEYGSLIPHQAWTPQYNFYGDLTYKAAQDQFTASASRAEYPFGNGTEALLTQVTLGDTHKVNELFSIGVNAGYQTASYQFEAPGDLNSLISGGGNVTYHVTPKLDLSTTYQYRYENLVGTTSSAEDNVVLVSLSFKPGAWTY